MYVSGALKTGNASYDLSDNDYISQEQLEEYSKGSVLLSAATNSARYAFYADHPEIFYVNFQKITVRVTKDQSNRYHAKIGSGSFKNYFVDGFESKEQVEEAEIEFNNRVNEIAEAAKNLQIGEGQNLNAQQVKYVHNEIIYNTSYRLEGDCTEGNEGFLGTPYGALVRKQAVCEGYARALKTILDKVGINSILVQGLHQSEDSAAIAHMWNYVQIEKETNTRAVEKVWYAVDATMDDPYLRKIKLNDEPIQPGDDIEEGFENTRYCLVGAVTMKKEHIILEEVEVAGNYKFEYPELYIEDYGIDLVINKDGLLVKYKQDGRETEEYKAGDFYISYNGKGYDGASKEGKYIIMRTHYYKPGDEEWQISPWAYFLPDVYAGGFNDFGDYLYVTIPNSEYVEFAVTTLAPGDYINNPLYLAYQGDGSDFVVQTGKLYNPSGLYKGKPYIKTQTPAATATLYVGPTYHVDVTYDDDLVLETGATEAGYKMVSTGTTGAEKSEITNFVWDGKRRVTFDLKFSQMFADDNASYRIYLTGLVGKNSGKEPLEITYGAANAIACSFSMNKAKNWEVFARPSLIESEDLSMNDWKTKDGTPVSDMLKSRVALVTTRTTTEEKNEMDSLMQNELGSQEIKTSETYNISLNVCRKYVVKTGHRLRLSLGFPEGYGPDDAGVTFKAYHFITNDKGEVTGVEEIPCVVTQYGLIVTCDSFSPFAVAVVENDGTTNTKKYVIASSSEGGLIEGANRQEGNVLEVSEGESKSVTVKADEGYEIDTLTVFGEVIDMAEVQDKSTMNININYEDIKNGNSIINATFVAKEVVDAEKEQGLTVVMQKAVPVEIQMPKTEELATINREITINPTVTETEGIQRYQWYKDGIALEGKVNKTLSFVPLSADESGEYTLKVTTVAGTTSEEVISQPCNIIIRSFDVNIVSGSEEINLNELQPGDEFELNANVSNLRNINFGLTSLTGQLEYDSDILERISMTGQNGWNLDNNYFNNENLKFIMDNSGFTGDSADIIKMRFKVKENLSELKQTTVKIKGISTSGGNGIIIANDAEIELRIKMKEEITSEKYIINKEEKDISRIAPGTTIRSFKDNVTTKQEMVFKDKEGNVMNDENTVLKTGMTVNVGETLMYTLVVTGDIDGDGEISINDLAKLKLHLIGLKSLNGAELKAADVDGDGHISINDVAQLKLVIIGLLEIK